jgi:hypothetical protein
MHSAAGANLVDIPDCSTDSVMIKLDPVLQMGSMAIACVVNHFEKIASEKSGQLTCINLVILISFGRYQLVTSRLTDNELLHLLAEIAIKPAGHRPLFHRKDLSALE